MGSLPCLRLAWVFSSRILNMSGALMVVVRSAGLLLVWMEGMFLKTSKVLPEQLWSFSLIYSRTFLFLWRSASMPFSSSYFYFSRPTTQPFYYCLGSSSLNHFPIDLPFFLSVSS